MDTWELVNTVGIMGALITAAVQVHRAARDAKQRDAERRVERALQLYSDLVVDGATADAFHRLSVLLRQLGSERHGKTTWLLLDDRQFDTGGILDPLKDERHAPFEDLYRVLWYFERVDTALNRGLVDKDVLFETIGFHCWWWAQLLRSVKSPKATAAITALGPRASDWAKAAGEYATWVAKCSNDFDGHGPTTIGAPTLGAHEVPLRPLPPRTALLSDGSQ